MSQVGLFAEAPSDKLGRSGIRASITERRVYDIVAAHRGHENAISIEIIRRMTSLSERAIKGAVAELVVTHHVLIGGSRQNPIGYFMIESDADRAAASAPLEGQIIQMLRRLRVLNSKHQVREWLGQQAAQLEAETE